MSSNREAWISRRGQADADAAIDQVIDRQTAGWRAGTAARR